MASCPLRELLLRDVKLTTLMNHKLKGIFEHITEKPKLCGLHIMFTNAVTSYMHTCACRKLSLCRRQ